MIKPDKFREFLQNCETADAEFIGRICLALAGRPDIQFSRAEKLIFRSIKADSDSMDEHIRILREKERDRKWIYRHKNDHVDLPEMSHGVPRDMAGQTWCPTGHGGTPRARARVLNSSNNNIINKNINTDPDTDSDKGGVGGKPESDRSGSGSGSVDISKIQVSKITGTVKKPNVWEIPDDELLYGTEVRTEVMLKAAFGNGGWAKAVAQVGNEAVRQLLLTFRSEIRQGESVENAAAAFTERCKNDLGVDFGLSMAESRKIGKGNGVS